MNDLVKNDWGSDPDSTIRRLNTIAMDLQTLCDNQAVEIAWLRAFNADAEVQIAQLRDERDEAYAHIAKANSQREASDWELEEMRKFLNTLRAERDEAEANLHKAEEMLHRVYFASRIDVLMEGPRLSGWNRPELDRLWPELRDLVTTMEQREAEKPHE